MSIFSFLTRLKPPPRLDENAIFFNVECDRCHERIRVRVDKKSDLEDEYSSSAAYILKKEILGKNCSNLMRLKVSFDKNYSILSREVEGGRVITLR